MDIQRKAFEESNNVNPDWSFKFDEELQQYVAVDFEMTNQVDEFNEHWDTFRAGWDAKAQAVPEGFVLDAPARVGGGVFRKGVKWKTVIESAQRLYEHSKDEIKPIVSPSDLLKIASGELVLVPRKATKKMIERGYEAHDCFFTLGSVRNVWDAMIEAQELSHD